MARVSRLGVLATCVAVVAAGGAAWVVTGGREHPAHHPQPAAATPRAPVLSRPTGGSPPSPEAVARMLAATARSPAFAGSLAGLVVDASTGLRVFGRDASAPMAPASTAKLLTATAALKGLGPSATLSTGVVRAGRTLYLVGGGDVTLTVRPSPGYPGAASLADLAARTAAVVRDGRPMHVAVDASAWTGPVTASGWTPTYLREGDVSRLSALEVDEARIRPAGHDRDPTPARQAGLAFAALLRRAGVPVTGPVTVATAPASGFGVASVSSPPMAALVRRMLTVSDNDLAEALARAVAGRAGLPRDFAGAAAAVTARLHALGVPVDGLQLYDGSGLSRLDRVTAAALVTVLQLAAQSDHPELRPVLEGLPVAGLTGTLADRFDTRRDRAAAGVVRAKTGNLVGVDTLAGEVVDADGRLLFFAFLTGRATSPPAAEAALDALAARLRSCGCGSGGPAT